MALPRGLRWVASLVLSEPWFADVAQSASLNQVRVVLWWEELPVPLPVRSMRSPIVLIGTTCSVVLRIRVLM
jgi:hypothetical protein